MSPTRAHTGVPAQSASLRAGRMARACRGGRAGPGLSRCQRAAAAQLVGTAAQDFHHEHCVSQRGARARLAAELKWAGQSPRVCRPQSVGDSGGFGVCEGHRLASLTRLAQRHQRARSQRRTPNSRISPLPSTDVTPPQQPASRTADATARAWSVTLGSRSRASARRCCSARSRRRRQLSRRCRSAGRRSRPLRPVRKRWAHSRRSSGPAPPASWPRPRHRSGGRPPRRRR